MTLILSNVNPSTKLVSLSDVLISTPTKDGQSAELKLPFQSGPLVLPPDIEYSPSGVAQKTVVFGRTAVMWADLEIVARILCAKIFEASDGGSRLLSLEEIQDAYGPDHLTDLPKISFIYHFFDDDGAPIRIAWNCEEIQFEQFDIRVAGTGNWNFTQNMNFNKNETPSNVKPGAVLPELLSKVALNSTAEQMGNHTLQFLYGGWLELMSTIDGFIEKLPYAVKSWAMVDGKLMEGPLFFGWYDGFDLCVTRLNPGNKLVENFWVRDLLEREAEKPSEPIVPAMILHAVHNGDGRIWNFIDPFGLTTTNSDIRVTRDREVRAWYSRRLRKLLVAQDAASGITNFGQTVMPLL